MSVNKHGDGWQVRWKDYTGKQNGRTFARKGDADTADQEIKRRKRLGQELSGLFLDHSEAPTLAQFVTKGFKAHAVTLSRRTRDQYKWALDLHLTELLDVPIDRFDVPRLAEHQRYLLDHGRTPNTTRTALTMLSGILQVAVQHGEITTGNPVRSLTKVQADPKPDVRPLSPVELEQLIADLTGRARIISVLAGHLGLSPVEVRLAPWQNLSDDYSTLLIEAAKTKRQRARPRVITVPRATQAELRAWRLQAGRPAGDTPIIGPFSVPALKQWGTRTLHPQGISLYTLRHSHASALHHLDTMTLASAAKRMGHSQTVHLKHYSHVIDALEGRPKFRDLDALIAWARESAVPTQFPNANKNT